MKFVQIIEMKTSKIDEIRKLADDTPVGVSAGRRDDAA
jgi:hypothetical protein